jgi:hypothetical protein
MPVVSFRPVKARLVIEPGRDSVLVMKVTVAPDERVALAGGGALESLSGSLRIRERGEDRERQGKVVGSLAYVEARGEGESHVPAHFQVDISLSSAKFDALLKIAIAGELPTRLYVQARGRRPGRGTRGIEYAEHGGERVKVWDIRQFPSLPVTNFSMVLPIGVRTHSGTAVVPAERALVEAPAANTQVVELADQLAVFQGETRNALTAVVAVVIVIGVLLLIINIVLIIK